MIDILYIIIGLFVFLVGIFSIIHGIYSIKQKKYYRSVQYNDFILKHKNPITKKQNPKLYSLFCFRDFFLGILLLIVSGIIFYLGSLR